MFVLHKEYQWLKQTWYHFTRHVICDHFETLGEKANDHLFQLNLHSFTGEKKKYQVYMQAMSQNYKNHAKQKKTGE